MKTDLAVYHLPEIIQLECPLIEKFALQYYSCPESLQSRLERSIDDININQALELRKKTGLPFWDTLLSAALIEPASFNNNLIKHATFHNSTKEPIEHYTVLETKQIIKDKLKISDPRKVLALNSSVVLKDQTTRHLPMFDFHIPSSLDSLNIAIQISEQLLGKKFILLDSGKSFHLYGLSIVTTKELHKLLHKSLLLSPLVDSRYIAHQLIDGSCKLRISTGESKPLPPRIIWMST